MNPSTKSRDLEEILSDFHQAMIHKSVEEFASLFADEAHYEFPFLTPGRPTLYRNRKEIFTGFKIAWDNAPVQVNAIENVVVYKTTDPSILISEFIINATVTTSGINFKRSALLIIQVRDGLVIRARDYSDVLSGIREMGRVQALVDRLGGA